MREKNPRRHTTAIPVKSMTSSAVHWSCGQYVDAVTGARLKPMSMTTAPVTTGGIAAWMIRAPKRCTARPARKSATPTTKTAPGDDGTVPATGPDRRGHAHEGERTAEIAGHPAARGEQEDGRRDTGHHDREVRVQPHEHRGDERSAEHRNHVLGAEPERTGPGEPLVGPDHGPRCGGLSVAVQGPAHAEAAHGRSLCVRVWVRAVPGAVFVRPGATAEKISAMVMPERRRPDYLLPPRPGRPPGRTPSWSSTGTRPVTSCTLPPTPVTGRRRPPYRNPETPPGGDLWALRPAAEQLDSIAG